MVNGFGLVGKCAAVPSGLKRFLVLGFHGLAPMAIYCRHFVAQVRLFWQQKSLDATVEAFGF